MRIVLNSIEKTSKGGSSLDDADAAHVPKTTKVPRSKRELAFLCCKEVFCSCFLNKHMLQHYQQINHCLILSLSGPSVWRFSCNSYLDTEVIPQLRTIFEAFMLEFGKVLQLQHVYEAYVLKYGKVLQLRPVYEAYTLKYGKVLQLRPVSEAYMLKYVKAPPVPYQIIEDTSVKENQI